MRRFSEMYDRWLLDPEGFWSEAAGTVQFCRPWSYTLDDTDPPAYHWFRGGITNTCYNALDRHVIAGRDEQPALVFEDPGGSRSAVYTYRRLTDDAARFAGALRSTGVRCGSRVLLSLPASPATAIAMLGCARIGAVHAAVPAQLEPSCLAALIDAARPAVVVASPGRALEAALELAAHPPRECVVLHDPDAGATRPPEGGRWLDDLLAEAPPAPCAALDPAHPLYLKFTAIGPESPLVIEQGGHSVGMAWAMVNLFDFGPGAKCRTAAAPDSSAGHSGVYGPLLLGGTAMLTTTPLEPDHVRTVSQRTGPVAHLGNVGAQRTTLPPSWQYWWPEGFAWPVSGAGEGDPAPPGSVGKALPGHRIAVLAPDGRDAGAGEAGEIVLELPLPPGSPTFQTGEGCSSLVRPERRGWCYRTGVGGRIDSDGNLWLEPESRPLQAPPAVATAAVQ